jgi:hypothetical protein
MEDEILYTTSKSQESYVHEIKAGRTNWLRVVNIVEKAIKDAEKQQEVHKVMRAHVETLQQDKDAPEWQMLQKGFLALEAHGTETCSDLKDLLKANDVKRREQIQGLLNSYWNAWQQCMVRAGHLAKLVRLFGMDELLPLDELEEELRFDSWGYYAGQA